MVVSIASDWDKRLSTQNRYNPLKDGDAAITNGRIGDVAAGSRETGRGAAKEIGGVEGPVRFSQDMEIGSPFFGTRNSASKARCVSCGWAQHPARPLGNSPSDRDDRSASRSSGHGQTIGFDDLVADHEHAVARPGIAEPEKTYSGVRSVSCDQPVPAALPRCPADG